MVGAMDGEPVGDVVGKVVGIMVGALVGVNCTQASGFAAVAKFRSKSRLVVSPSSRHSIASASQPHLCQSNPS